MKNTLSFSIFFLVTICNAQTIKVTVKEAQIFSKFGTHSNQAVLKAPDEDRGLKQIDCDYTFDLQEKTSTFFSRSLGGVGNTLPIVNITKNGSQYIIETADHGRYDASFLKLWLGEEHIQKKILSKKTKMNHHHQTFHTLHHLHQLSIR